MSYRPAAPRGAILIICDDDEAAERIAGPITELGYGVIEAQDGILGLSIIETSPPLLAAVVIDLQGPLARSASYARQIATFRPQLPLIVVGVDPAALASNDSPRRFLPRPHSAATLLHALEDLLP